jgi:uncharacterized protein YjiS (DUF1127 family)
MNTRQNQAPDHGTLVEPGLRRRIAAIVDRGDEGHLVPGTRVTMDELHRYQLLGRQLQARAVAQGMAQATAWTLGGLRQALVWPFRRVAGALERAQRKRASIRSLDALDDHFLADIGITRDQIPVAVAGLLERSEASNTTPPAPTLVHAGDRPAACNDADARRAA